jgi:SAM-dependent methyltransferase
MGSERYRCTSPGLGIHPDIFRCRQCTMVFNEAVHAPLGHLQEYADVEDPAHLAEKHSRRLTYERELERIEALSSGRDLLDVGSYTGFFLDLARERGWRVMGVEPSRWAAHHAAAELGLEVFNGPIEHFETARSFDVVTLWDVFEHLVDPVAVLSRIRRLLKPGGLLAFTTHNLDAPLARLLGGRYPFFMEMHTIHINSRTRDLLLAKTGFTLVDLHTHRRAVRFSYLLSRLRRFGELPARLADHAARGLGLADRILWVGFVGLETIIARSQDADGR